MSGSNQIATTVALVASGVALGGVLFAVSWIARDDRQPRKVSARRSRRRSRVVETLDEDESSDDSPVARSNSKFSRRAAQTLRQSDAMSLGNLEDETLALQAGFSMEQARMKAEERHEKAMNRTPAEVLAELQRGNARFWTGQATRPEKSAFERRALISKQFPSTAILGCSDSRVPIEIVFDQGLGDMFVIRVAGNCLDTTTNASLQYSVQHLKVKVLIVMGHEGCGAVKAAQLPSHAIDQEPEVLGAFLKTIKKGLSGSNLAKVQDVKAQDREAVTTNVRVQVDALVKDECIMSKVRSGELIILGAFYEISSGIVDFFHEVSGKEDDEETEPIKKAPSRGVLTRWRSPESKAD